MPRLIILDCDGFLTDVEHEGKGFVKEYLKNLAGLTERSVRDILQMQEECETQIRAHPEKYGFTDEKGRIVAPANADPYLRMAPVMESVLDTFGMLLDRSERKKKGEELFRASYSHTKTAFRPGVKRAIAALEGTNTHVVTNSHTDAVQKKMRRLGAMWLVERVHGLARKFNLVDDWNLVPETMTLPGLKRPVYLRRKFYYDVLDALRREAGVEWEDMVVAGDIFELDLAVALALGATIALLPNENTPQYEIDYVAAHPRGHVLTSIAGILPLVGIA